MDTNGNKRGRPRALTPEKQDEVLRLLSVGGSRKMAARFVGVSVTTIADEAKRNEDFSDRLLGAEAKGYFSHLKKITESSDWRSAAWFLARKYPEEFAEERNSAQPDNPPITSEQQRSILLDAINREIEKRKRQGTWDGDELIESEATTAADLARSPSEMPETFS